MTTGGANTTAWTPPVVWEPTAAEVEGSQVSQFLLWLERERGLRFADYAALRRWSVDDLDAFWDAVWHFYGVDASRPYRTVLGGSRGLPGATWFEGARLNYAEQVLAAAPHARPAIVAVGEGREPVELSGAQLRGQVGALAAALAEMGVGPGDRVAAYLPNVPETVVAMLAVTSLGAVWSACAPDFGTQSVVDRFAQLEPTVLIAVDGYQFGGREHDRRDTVRRLARSCPPCARRSSCDPCSRAGPSGATRRGRLTSWPRRASRGSHRSPRTIRCGSSSRRARRARPRASSRATRGSCSSISRRWACAWTSHPRTATSSTARRAGWPGTTWSAVSCTARRSCLRPGAGLPGHRRAVGRRRPTGATVLGMGSAYVARASAPGRSPPPRGSPQAADGHPDGVAAAAGRLGVAARAARPGRPHRLDLRRHRRVHRVLRGEPVAARPRGEIACRWLGRRGRGGRPGRAAADRRVGEFVLTGHCRRCRCASGTTTTARAIAPRTSSSTPVAGARATGSRSTRAGASSCPGARTPR